MNFILLDLILLAILIIFISIFLYKGRKNLGQEGILILYRTKWGIKLIEHVGNKYKKTLKVLSYVSISLGYVLMIGIVWLFVRTVYLYITEPLIRETIRAPPIAPVIPYFPQLFGLSDFFPPFYAIYFIVSIVIVATVHEFSHGIFAKRYGIKIKSTGFAFLKYFPAIFGAFVEQDDKQMNKKSKFEQKSVLSAGVFANILVTIIFFLIISVFFTLSFSVSGVFFSTYTYSPVKISEINSIDGILLDSVTIEKILESFDGKDIVKIEANGKSYLAVKELIEKQKDFEKQILLFDDSPAINANLVGVITEINGKKITSVDILSETLNEYSPGDQISIKTKTDDGEKTYEIILEENPQNPGKPWLGIGITKQQSWITAETTHFLSSFQQKNVNIKNGVYYEAKNPGAALFFYYLLWWIVFINLVVALINMLPVGIFDGGKFFYLTILTITKSQRVSKKIFSLVTSFFLFLILLLMVFWILSFT